MYQKSIRFREKLSSRYKGNTIRKETNKVICFSVGKRTNLFKKVIDQIYNTSPIAIFIDKLRNYKSLISTSIHKTGRFLPIENLALRTHLKRLNRKTIYFSKREVFGSYIKNIFLGVFRFFIEKQMFIKFFTITCST